MTTSPPSDSAIFKAAVQLPPEQRASYLCEACGDNRELRAEVESLLRAHAPGDSFLKMPVPAATIDQPLERAGTQIGPYKLLQQIGEGGMGVVYMAEQTEPVKRRVALKIIKPGMDTRQVIARFEAERQALSLMDHPNIAKVLDAGTTESGRPYFVMELVKGQPITQYCDDKHLTPRQRLELLLPVCQAIQHAHQKGIIHRDIKPTNILVAEYDQQPVPKVIDFGVAKATSQTLTEKTMFTGLGQIVGTLEYMSPEQAKVNQLDIDTRSDIYSLGVLLYELLTGSTPFDRQRLRSAAFDEMLRIIREEEPPKPSTRLSDSHDSLPSISAQRQTEPAKLTKLVRGELDWIVMKALEKDRNRRYETASSFAADVQRYLDDEPVQACPPSAGYRLSKFTRRNKRGLAMVAVLALAVLIAAATLGWSARDRAAREQQIAQDRAKKLALTEEGIRQALDRGTRSRAELQAILKKPGGAQELLNQPARWELYLKMAQSELAQARRSAVRAEVGLKAESTQGMDNLEQQLTSDQADFNLAQLLEKTRLDYARVVDRNFDYRTAADAYSKALAGFAPLTDDPAVVAARIASSPIKDQLVAALDDWARMPASVISLQSAQRLLAVARSASPDPVWGDRLRQLPPDLEALDKLIAHAPPATMSPVLLEQIGRYIHDMDQQEAWLRKAQAEHPTDFWLNFDLAVVLHNKNNPVEAAGFYRVALAVRPGTSIVYNNLAGVLKKQGKPDEAIAAYRKAIEYDPKGVVLAYLSLARVYEEQQQQLPAAIATYRQAIKAGVSDARIYDGLAVVLYQHGDLNDAVATNRRALEMSPKSAKTLVNLGLALNKQGKLDDAIAACRKAIEIDPNLANAHMILGLCLSNQGKDDDAIACYRKVIELDPKLANADNSLANAHNNIGSIYADRGKLKDAIASFSRAIEINPRHGMAHRSLAELLATCPDLKFRDPRLAVEYAEKAIGLLSQTSYELQVLGWAQYRAGDWRESIVTLEKSCKLQPGGTGDAGQWIVMALAHWKLSNETELPDQERSRHNEEARRWFEQADKQIEGWGRVRPHHRFGQAIWDFRLEARSLKFAEEIKK